MVEKEAHIERNLSLALDIVEYIVEGRQEIHFLIHPVRERLVQLMGRL